MFENELKALAGMSNKFGSDAEYVLAGGGNTSFKNEDYLFVKGSGTSLATIKPDEFVKMDRRALHAMWDKKYPENEEEREAAVLEDMMAARVYGETRRPSVETLLHELFEQKYVLHVHPAAINGVTCSVDGAECVKKLFPDAVWVPVCKPGYILALNCRDAIKAKMDENGGVFPQILLLQNHGLFVAADTAEEAGALAEQVYIRIQHEAEAAKCLPDMTPVEDFDIDRAASIAPVLRMLYSGGTCEAAVKFTCNKAVLEYDPSTKSLTPDHIVYTKAAQLVIAADSDNDGIVRAFNEFTEKNGYMPRIVLVSGLGMFACGKNIKEASIAQEVFLDAVKITVYAKNYGGVQAMPDWLIDFIVNWEVESYRSKVSLAAASRKRLEGKIVVVTGGAQGFGKGIADAMAAEGANVVIADMNADGAKATADTYGIHGFSVAANVTDENSVKNMIDRTVLAFGGLDVFVNNAGIAKAGSLEEMTQKTLEFVTAVNYTGYYLCAKYASRVMKLQHQIAPSYMMDIIEINSKSGLEGSNKNFAYAGSKFGGIGLTQSFALELVPYNIKVNAVCPGNFLNGPLWSDPEKGLFVQYLNAGKVPGAKTVEDVRRFYESKVPMNRGCETIDVARALFYIIEQEYETGQAIPVTGGQVMLK